MRFVMGMVIASCTACAAAPAPVDEPRASEAPPPVVDLVLAEQHYREHAVAIRVGDVETYRASLADPTTCIEDVRDVRPSEIDSGGLPPAYEIRWLRVEALPDGGARVREWISRRQDGDGPRRIEPRAVDLHRVRNRFVVTRIASVDHPCGDQEILRNVSLPPELARCDAVIEACVVEFAGLGMGRDAYVEEQCDARRQACLLGRDARGCASLLWNVERTAEAGACSSDGWCVVYPDRPSPGPTRVVAGASIDDLWAGGSNGLWHFDGSRWEPVPEIRDTVSSIARFDDGTVAVAAAGDVFVRDAGAWARIHVHESGAAGTWVYAVAGVSRDAMYAVGSEGFAMRCDRAGCERLPRVSPASLCGVVATPDEVIAVGEGGTVVRSDGPYWRVERLPSLGLEAVGLDERGRPTLLGYEGEGPVLLRREGADWVRDTDLPPARLSRVVGSVAVGSSGAFARINGAWTPVPEAGDALSDAWVGGDARVFVGALGVHRQSGGRWHRDAIVTPSVRDIAPGSIPSDVVVGGDTTLLRWNGVEWSVIEAPFSFDRVFRLSDARVMVTGHRHTAILADGTWSARDEDGLSVSDVVRLGSDIVGQASSSDGWRGLVAWSGDRWERTLEAEELRAIAGRARGLRSRSLEGQDEQTYVLEAVERGRVREIWRGGERPYEIAADGEVIAFRTDTNDGVWVSRGGRFELHPGETVGGSARGLYALGGRVYARLHSGSVAELAGRTWTQSQPPEGVRMHSLARVGDELWGVDRGAVLRRTRR